MTDAETHKMYFELDAFLEMEAAIAADQGEDRKSYMLKKAAFELRFLSNWYFECRAKGYGP